MSFWDTTRYGFSPVYWLTVSGIPVVWAERATGLALPTGFTIEDAGLVIDDSAEVGVEQIDRQRGVAASLSLGFKLLDTSTLRDWLRRWSYQAVLTADLAPTGLTITVGSTTGWPAGWPVADELHLGIERITYTGTTATTFTGCTRAQSGSLAYRHVTGTTAQFVTDRPKYWLGREVILWASPTDPAGFVTGATLDTDARHVWRGRITDGPQRERDGFRFEAQSLDRILDNSLVASISGQVVDTSAQYVVQSGWTATVVLAALTNAGAEVWRYDLVMSPFKNDTDGDLMSGQKMRDRIVAEWDSAVTTAAAGADLSSWKWQVETPQFFRAYATVVFDALIFKINRWVFIDGKEWADDLDPYYPGGMPAGFNGAVKLPWMAGDNPTKLVAFPGTGAPVAVSSVTLLLDSGAASDVPATGKVKLDVNGATVVYSYSYSGSSQGQVYLAGLVPVAAGKSAVGFTPAQLQGASAEILFDDAGTFPDMMLRTLYSSGTSGLRSATYDTLKRGQGYGLEEDQIAEDSFSETSAPLAVLLGTADHAGRTFAELFGGALGLFRRAVVARPDVSQARMPQQLHLVDTAPFGAGYTTTITDDDLLSDEGDPVLSVRRADSPNQVTVIRPLAGTKDAADRWSFGDHASADASGRREVEYTVPAQDRAALWLAAWSAAGTHLAADETTQAIELRVPPWVDAEVGDLVQLELTHPSLWTWSSSPAAVGYTGIGRVLGRRMSLKSTQVTLLLLIDGAVKISALSPAARVLAFAGAAGNPTSIDVDYKYYKHFAAALVAAGVNIWVYHYQPGQVETVTQKHEISAAAIVVVLAVSYCRLTVDSTSGGHTLVVADRSTLTLPTTSGGDLTTYQATFAHVDDDTQWG